MYQPRSKIASHYGVRPSGHIHLGNVVTATYALMLLEKEDHEQKKFVVTVNDWDGSNTSKGNYDFGIPISQRKKGSDTRRESLEQFITFLEEISSQIKVDMDVIPTSYLMKDNHAKQLIKQVCDNNESISQILGDGYDGIHLFPLDVKTGRYAFKSYLSRGTIMAVSLTEDGEESHFEYELGSDVPFEMPIQVKLPIKHAVLNAQVDHFVLGGNYSWNTIQKMVQISKLLGFDIKYERGPLVVLGNRVMAKSRENTYLLTDALERKSSSELYSILREAIAQEDKRIRSEELIRVIEND